MATLRQTSCNNTPVKGMDPYEMYSTLNGLINVYDKYKEDDTELAAQAIDCAIKLADYLVATIGDENTEGLLSGWHAVRYE